jgi:hypothetical protein
LTAPAQASGTERMLATTYDASTDLVSFYIDGALQSSGTISGGFDLSQIASGGSNGIGGFDGYGDGATPGTTDEFRIYSGALNSTQIATDASNGPNVVNLPEPASFSILAIGGIGLLARRRRVNQSPGR